MAVDEEGAMNENVVSLSSERLHGFTLYNRRGETLSNSSISNSTSPEVAINELDYPHEFLPLRETEARPVVLVPVGFRDALACCRTGVPTNRIEPADVGVLDLPADLVRSAVVHNCQIQARNRGRNSPCALQTQRRCGSRLARQN